MIFAGDQHKGGKPPKKHAPSASAEGPLAAVGRPEANLADDPSNRSAREKLRLGLGSEMGDLVNTSTNTNHKIQEKKHRIKLCSCTCWKYRKLRAADLGRSHSRVPLKGKSEIESPLKPGQPYTDGKSLVSLEGKKHQQKGRL